MRYCSSNNRACLVKQADGNLVVYDERGAARWSTRTNGSDTLLMFQFDGNLVLHKNGGIGWSLDRKGGRSDYRNTRYLDVQTDGNVVMYGQICGGNLCNILAMWATGTNH